MGRRSEITAIIAKVEALALMVKCLDDPVIDMLVSEVWGRLAELLASAGE